MDPSLVPDGGFGGIVGTTLVAALLTLLPEALEKGERVA